MMVWRIKTKLMFTTIEIILEQTRGEGGSVAVRNM